MSKFSLLYADYPLRPHEREFALMELRGTFPDARISQKNNDGVVLHTRDVAAREKLRHLAFFSKFGNDEAWESTVSHKLESGDGKKGRGTRNIRYFAHGLHEYKGRFYPQLCKSLVNATGGANGVVLDPFCGCGTLLLEAALNNVAAIGVEINPMGKMIASAKIASLKLGAVSINKMYQVLIDDPILVGGHHLKRPILNGNAEYLKRWFPESNLTGILQLHFIIESQFKGNARLFLRIILSNLLKRFSWQEPSEQRIRRRKDTPPSNVHEYFQERLSMHLEQMSTLKNIHRVGRPNIEVHLGDARCLPIKENSIDSVVTSPPYATALPYIEADRLSLHFFGLVDQRTFKDLGSASIGNREISRYERVSWEARIPQLQAEKVLPREILHFLENIRVLNTASNVGFRRKNTAALLCKYFLDMSDSLKEMYRVLKPSAKAALVVGDNFTVAGGKPKDIPTSYFINLIAKRNGFRIRSVTETSPPNAYNIYSRNSIRRESVTVLEKRA